MLHQGSGNLFSGEVGHMLSVVVQATILSHTNMLALTLAGAVIMGFKRAALRGALHGLPVEGSALIVLEVALPTDS
jgi:hypothetical protein